MTEDQIPAWDYTKVYQKGDKVRYFQDIYVAKCYTQGHPEDDDWYDPTEVNEYGQNIQ